MMKRVIIVCIMFLFISATNSGESTRKPQVQISINPATQLDNSVSKLDSSLNNLDHKIKGL